MYVETRMTTCSMRWPVEMAALGESPFDVTGPVAIGSANVGSRPGRTRGTTTSPGKRTPGERRPEKRRRCPARRPSDRSRPAHRSTWSQAHRYALPVHSPSGPAAAPPQTWAETTRCCRNAHGLLDTTEPPNGEYMLSCRYVNLVSLAPVMGLRFRARPQMRRIGARPGVSVPTGMLIGWRRSTPYSGE